MPAANDSTIIQTSSRVTILNTVRQVIVTLTCTADSGDGSFIATGNAILNPATLGITGWKCYSVQTNPGAVGPTDNYDITFVDADGYDQAGGLLTNLDISTTEKVYLDPVGPPTIDGNWTVTITGNSVNSAVVVITIVFKPE